MGRWSQRTRAGGGASINFMTLAVHDDPETMLVTYLNNVDATAFTVTSFTASPSTEQSIAITQQSAKVIKVEFLSDVSGDNELIYQGPTPGVLTPQNLPVT